MKKRGQNEVEVKKGTTREQKLVKSSYSLSAEYYGQFAE